MRITKIIAIAQDSPDFNSNLFMMNATNRIGECREPSKQNFSSVDIACLDSRTRCRALTEWVEE